MLRSLTPLLTAISLALCGCTDPCGPTNCSGCCRGNTCYDVSSLDDCGIGGEICKTCESTGQECVDGFCVAASCGAQGVACPGSTCCSGLECRAGSCQPPVACVAGGGACATLSDCCADLACASGTCQPCGQPGQPCCSGGSSCVEGFWCSDGKTCSAYFADTGKACTKNSECSQGLCLPLGNGKNACTITCADADRCLGGWECKPLTGSEGQVCQCTPKPEACNGKDDDCNSWVDDTYLDDDCQKILPGSVCKAGGCVCPEGKTDCSGGCVDLASSDEHCGTCTKSCVADLWDPSNEDAGCFASACRSWERIVEHGLLGYGTLLVVGGTLWLTTDGTSNGTVESCATAGCNGAPSVRVTGLASPRQLATWAGDVYYATELGIERYAPASDQDTLVAPETRAAGGMTISGGTLVWASLSRTDPECALMRCTLPACQDETKVVSAECVYGHLVADATHFYWTGNLADGTEVIKRCALAGCPSGPETVTPGSAEELVVDGGSVFWTDMSTQKVWSCPVSGCEAPTAISSKTYFPYGIAVDAVHVYWVDDNSLLRCPRAGCTGEPERLANQPPADSGQMIVLDATSVFWSTDYGVWKTAK